MPIEPVPLATPSEGADYVDPAPTEIVIQAPVPGLPPLEAHQLPLRRVPFSTRKFVRDLEQAGIERPMAETVMRATRGLLTRQEGKANQAILNRQDLENVRPPPCLAALPSHFDFFLYGT